MFAALVNEGRDRATVEVIEAPASQRKTVGGQVGDQRRKIELVAKPRLHRVPIGRDHVGQVIDLERTDVSGDDPVLDPAVRTPAPRQQNAKRGTDADHHEKSGGQRDGPQPRFPACTGTLARSDEGRLVERGMNLSAQRGGCRVPQRRRGERCVQRAQVLFGLRAGGTAAEVLLDLQAVDEVQLAVGVGGQQLLDVLAVHFASSPT